MAKEDCYLDTAERMYESANALYQKGHWLNTCYLAGYVVECYGKIMVELGIREGSYKGNKNRASAYSHHVEALSESVKLLSLSGGAISSYCVDLASVCPVLLEWNPFKIRYASSSDTWNTEARAQEAHAEMEKLIDTLIQMRVDGVNV